MRNTCASLFLTLALAACGGGGDSPNPPQGTPQNPDAGGDPAPGQGGNPPPPTSEIIEYYGDSTVWGLKSHTNDEQVAKPAPQAFAEALPGSPTTYTVRNEGVSNTSACQLRDGTDGRHDNWGEQMRTSQADVVIINHAINDLRQGESIATYSTCLRDLAVLARQNGKRVIFETPNPITAPSGLDSYVGAMKAVATENSVQIIDQYQYLVNRYPDLSVVVPDGLHPSDQVYIEKGQYAASVYVTLPRQ
jgi:lysophospholipase L1-like esterase